MNGLINIAASLLTLAFVAAYAVAAVAALWGGHGDRSDAPGRAAGPRRVTDRQIRRMLGGARRRPDSPLFQTMHNGGR